MALSPVFLICATSVLLAVQFVWTVEIAYGTPYLLHHGLTKSETALVWLAGPLSGIIVQPAIGVYSDSIKSSSFGRFDDVDCQRVGCFETLGDTEIKSK